MNTSSRMEPGAHRWLPSRTSGTFVNSYACVSVIYVYRYRGGKDLGTCPSRVSGHTVPHSEYPALKPTITLFGSRLSAIPPPWARYMTLVRNAVKERRSAAFKHSGRKINIFDRCISYIRRATVRGPILSLHIKDPRLYKFESSRTRPEHNFIGIIIEDRRDPS